MTKRNGEQGFVLVTAMIILLIIATLSVAVLNTVNVQTHQTGNERAGEAAFNIAESALQAEAYQLQVAWPSTAASALPTCNQATPQSTGCEGVALTGNLGSTYAGVDYANATWSAQTIDATGATSHYSDALAAPPTTSWDANGDGFMWVRALATVRGQQRIVVEQVGRQTTVLTLPQNVLTAGSVATESDGQGPYINAGQGVTGTVAVRCGTSPTTQPSQGAGNCLGWDGGKGQLSPPTAYQAGYVDGNHTLSTSQLAALKQTAVAAGTYFNGVCPAPTSGVVYVDNPPGGGCVYRGNGTWNLPPLAPGALIFTSGTVEFNGTQQFYGLLYMANQQEVPSYPCTPATQPVATIHGNAQVVGAVFVDGCGMVLVGSSGQNLTFAANALNSLTVAGAATPTQNTFQLIPNH